MSLEEALKENTEALRLMTMALNYCPQDVREETEAKPAEAKPAKAKPAEAKPAEAKPVKAKPVEAESSETQDAPTYQEVASVIVRLSKTKGKDVAIELLAKFGVTKLPDLDPSEYGKVMVAALELL